MTALHPFFALAAGSVVAASLRIDPGALGEASAQISTELSHDHGTLADTSAQSGAVASLTKALSRAVAAVPKRIPSSGSDRAVPLLPVLLVLALLALALAGVYILSLRRRLKAQTVRVRGSGRDRPGAQPSAPQPIRSLRVGRLHEQGRRQYQQDAFGISHEALMRDHGLLAVLADGMGGLADSERVSVTAVETILDRFSLVQGPVDPRLLLLQLVADARREVNRVLGAADLGRSGSTLVMSLIRDGLLYYLSVGDTRIYLLRDGALLQLTRENTYENELALRAINGQCEVQEAFTNPQRGGLTSFLGMKRLSAVDIPAAPVRLRPGDKVVLMTDGVYNALEEEVLTAQLLQSPEEAVFGLRAAIESRAYTNQDNYTALILECSGDEPPVGNGVNPPR